MALTSRVPAPAAAPSGAGQDELAALRERLDGLDGVLLETLRDRLRCCLEIAEVKRRHGIPMMQPHRVGYVHSRAAAYAAAHGVDAGFLRRLYELVIAETCRVETLVIDGVRPAGAGAPARG
jgi:4-amino-4-deoxychorismate mutase